MRLRSHWNASATPFVWGGKRAARRKRTRERRHAAGVDELAYSSVCAVLGVVVGELEQIICLPGEGCDGARLIPCFSRLVAGVGSAARDGEGARHHVQVHGVRVVTRGVVGVESPVRVVGLPDRHIRRLGIRLERGEEFVLVLLREGEAEPDHR